MTKPGQNLTSLDDLLALVRILRGPSGCPWDRVQTLKDLKQYLLEECYEVLEAIDEPGTGKLGEELGDLLFQIVFAGVLAEESGQFSLDGVIQGVHEKMVRRHPHVFGDVTARDVDAVKTNWMQIKSAEERAEGSLLDSVPRALPALQRAYRMGQRAGQAGLDWTGADSVLQKVKEEIRELEEAIRNRTVQPIQEELGDVLFALAQLARHLKQNPEEALQRSSQKFLARFRLLEVRARREGRALTSLAPEELNRWWDEVKLGA